MADAHREYGDVRCGVIALHPDGRIATWGSDAEQMFNTPASRALGLPLNEIVNSSFEVSGTAADSVFAASFVGVDGTTRDVHVAAIATPHGYTLVCTDRTAIERSQRHFHTIMESLHEGVLIMGSDGRFKYINAAGRRILGVTETDLVGRHHSDPTIILPMYDTTGHRISAKSHPGEYIQRTRSPLSGDVIGIDVPVGKRVWVVGRGCLLDPERPGTSSVLFSFTDVSDQHVAGERLRHDATHDSLTGLPNRAHALNMVAAGLAPSADPRLAAALFLDLDKLKTINDVHGHLTGDAVLGIAANRLCTALRPSDVLARVGGDEFLVLVFGQFDQSDVRPLSGRLHAALREPIVVHSVPVRTSVSIGATIVDTADARTADQIIRDADAAMYRAKATGPGNTAYM